MRLTPKGRWASSRLRAVGIVLAGAIAVAVAVFAVVHFTGSGSTQTLPPTGPTGASGPTGPTGPGSNKPPKHRIYWGAWIGRQFTGSEAPWDMKAVAKFQHMVRKGLSLIHFSSPFVDCRGESCGPVAFPVRAFDDVHNYGAIPFFSWSSSLNPVAAGEPDYTLASVYDGAHDAYIRKWAIAARDWGHPFFLEFDWEMNGTWYPWGEGANGNRHGDFALAWRHVHDIFTSVGATNATWVWCPNTDPEGSFTPFSTLYPGDSYVDWTCLDGYNRDTPWLTFDQLFGSSYRLLQRIAPGKPVIIGEIASTETGGSKAAWISDLLSDQLPFRYPMVRGVIWFEKYAGRDYPVESSEASKAAFVGAIQSPVYVPNVLRSLKAGPLRPRG